MAVRPAAAETRPSYGGKVIASLTSAPTSVDPLAAQSYAEVTFAALVFDTLYAVDAQGQVVPHLAEGMPVVSEGGLEARIKLRDGVKWSNGKDLRAADALASLQRAASAPATEWALAPVKKLAREKETLVLTLRRPTPELAQLLAVAQLAITPGGKAPTARNLVGSGPFYVKKLAEHRLDLLAAPDHFAGRAYVDRITLRWFDKPDDEARAYEAGEADVSLRGAVAFAGHTPKYATDVVDGTATILVFLGFGRAHPDLDADRDFRRAVSLAQSRSALKHVGAGERVLPALLPEAPDLGGASPASTEIAARIADARAALGKKGAKVALELIVDQTRPDDADVASRVVAALDELGLQVTYTALDPAEFARRVAAGKCDLYIGQLVAPATEASWEYALAFAAGGDRWPIAALQTGKFTRATAAAAFAERLPIVPLFHRAVRAHYRKTLSGVAFDALGRLPYAGVFFFAQTAAAGAAAGGGK